MIQAKLIAAGGGVFIIMFFVIYILHLLKKIKGLQYVLTTEKQKRSIAELEKNNIVNARKEEQRSHDRYRTATENYIKNQHDILLDHGINLMLEKDKPWSSE